MSRMTTGYQHSIPMAVFIMVWVSGHNILSITYYWKMRKIGHRSEAITPCEDPVFLWQTAQMDVS